MLTETSRSDIGEMIASRAERGQNLYLTSRQLITKHGEDAYSVPSSDGTRRYVVEYGRERESCGCTDLAGNRGEISCKHLVAVALLYAKRRSIYIVGASRGYSSLQQRVVRRRGEAASSRQDQAASAGMVKK